MSETRSTSLLSRSCMKEYCSDLVNIQLIEADEQDQVSSKLLPVHYIVGHRAMVDSNLE